MHAPQSLTVLNPDMPGIAAKYVSLAGLVSATFWTVSIMPDSVP
jgi:hypothetical protein